MFAAGLLTMYVFTFFKINKGDTFKTNKSDPRTKTLYTSRTGGRVHKVLHLKGDFEASDCPCLLLPHIKDWCQSKCCQ